MKYFLTLMIAFSISAVTYGQNKLKPSQYTLGVGTLSMQIDGEWRVTNKSTLLGEIGYGAFTISSLNENKYTGSSENNSDAWMPLICIAPYVQIENRHYFNLAQRVANGKNTANNAGDYWGIMARWNSGTSTIISEDVAVKPSYKMGGFYGFQRNVGKQNKWLLAVNMGYALSTNYNWSFIGHSPILSAKLKYVLR